MVKATWNGQVIAESENTVIVEGNHYFPPTDVHKEFLEPNDMTTTCPWKGVAKYFDVIVNGKRNEAAAWHYHDPKTEAAEIKDHIAFWKGVEVE